MSLTSIPLVTIPVFALLGACSGAPEVVDQAPTADSDTGDEPNVLPIDTSFFVPQDTAPQEPPNITPSDYIYLRHTGTWNLTGAPYTDLSGTLELVEHINLLDTGRLNDTTDTAVYDPYVCQATYALTGSAVSTHTCGAQCDFVFEVLHTLTAGDPGPCREPDVPANGAVWQLGYDGKNSRILLNYFGTDVWLPWYGTTSAPPNIDFDWEFTLAVELEDTATP